MSASKPYAHAQYGKLVLVVVLVFRSKGPYFSAYTGPGAFAGFIRSSMLQQGNPNPGGPVGLQFHEERLIITPKDM